MNTYMTHRIRSVRERLQVLLKEVEEMEREAGAVQAKVLPPAPIFERTHTGTFRDRLRDTFRGRLSDVYKKRGRDEEG